MSRWIIISFCVIFLQFPRINAEDADFIVVGAGAAGAAVANRLSEKGNYKVILLEAGEEPLQFTKIPYFGGGPMAGDMDWKYFTEKQENACQNFKNKKILVPRGKALGGSTAINAMIATRGNKKDYDEWEALGNKGWRYDEVLPFFKKLEHYQASFIQDNDAKYHGKDGPIHISRPHYSSPIQDAFLESSKYMGYTVNDHNAEKQTGFFNPVFTISNSSRWSTNDAYLKPILHRKNMQLIINAFVTRIIFDDDNRAIGVVYQKDGSEFIAKCTKEVILSGGAYNSPQLLMLSGIGPKETLEKFNIPVIDDLPGVGQNLKDHVTTLGVTYTFPEYMGVNHKYHVNAETMEMWERRREGPLTMPIGCECIAFVNSKYADPSNDYPDIEIMTLQIPGADLGMEVEAAKSAIVTEDDRSVLMILPIALRPKSSGYVTLRSDNPYDPPIIQPNFLEDNHDIDIVLEAVKFVHNLMETEPFRKIEARRLKRKVLGCENFEETSDDYYRCMIRHYTIHVFHPLGTCKMGMKEDKMAVVDSRLRVHGVKNLRVVDMSISPTMITAHTMIPAIMIGEKGAHMILEDWHEGHLEL